MKNKYACSFLKQNATGIEIVDEVALELISHHFL